MLFEVNPEAIGSYYGLSKLNKFVGFLTFDYLRPFTKDFVKESKKLQTYEAIVDYDKKNNFTDCILRNENLRTDLLNNYNLYAESEEMIEMAIAHRPKRSRTATEKKAFHLFYDDELKNLIYERDKFIFEKYGYTFEDLLKK